MARLTASARKSLPNSSFVGPNRSFPIPDESHARAALSMAHNAADPNAIRAAVHRRFPGIGERGQRGQMREDATHEALMRNFK